MGNKRANAKQTMPPFAQQDFLGNSSDLLLRYICGAEADGVLLGWFLGNTRDRTICMLFYKVIFTKMI